MRIELHIERLVLEGLPLGPGDAARRPASPSPRDLLRSV